MAERSENADPVVTTARAAAEPTPALPLEYQRPGHRKTYSIGTLTYTAAGLVVLFFWLLGGDFAFSMKDRTTQPVMALMLKSHHASDTLTGVYMSSIPAAVTMLLVPVISYRSDRHRGRWGRRIPYLLITTPIAAVAMLGVGLSPALGAATFRALGSPEGRLNPIVVGYIGAFWATFEIANLAANALFGALINDVVPHQFLGRFFGLFRALSLIAGMIFNYWMFGKAAEHFVAIFASVAGLYAIGFTVMCLKVREGEYPPPPPAEEESGGGFERFFGAAVQYFRECFAKPYYLWVFLGMTVAWLAFTPVNNFSVYYSRSIQMSDDEYGKLVALSYTISLILAYPLGWLADKFHPLRVGIVSIGLYALVALWGGMFARTIETFAVAFVLHIVLSGTYFTTTASLGQRLFPRASFAQFNSAWGLVLGAGTLLIGPIVGGILDATNHKYHLTFTGGFVLAAGGLLTLLVVHVYFMRLGGPKHYVPPQ